MTELFKLLSDEEIDYLDHFLVNRFDEEEDTEGKDEGVLDISELDGFLTALVSGPALIPPSRWLPALWGDFEPVWENEEEFRGTITLLMRHMNGIADILMNQPEDFEPLFLERSVEGKTHLIVDEWCEGYRRGVELAEAQWSSGGEEMAVMLAPIYAFTEVTEWEGHNYLPEEVEVIQWAIAPKVRKIHAYWLARREDFEPSAQPIRREGPQVGRNDPCPCGSGKKYKKCCLH